MSKDYVAGDRRDQSILLPETLEEYVTEENPVRFIDAFVDSLDLENLGFKRATLDGGAGRPPYNPSDLLKLYVYGYLNQMRSSRKLEKACVSNVEVMWLMKKLAPDFKTIADFRKDNVECIKPVFKELVFLCRSLDLFGAELVAIDGSKFKAVNSRNRNFNEKTLAERLKRVEERISRYLKEIEENDRIEAHNEEKDRKGMRLSETIGKLQEKRRLYLRVQERMKKEETCQKEVSLTDPESRLMRVNNQSLDVCYNAHVAVDSKNKMFVDYDVTNSPSDGNALSTMARGAREALEVERLGVTADKGFYDALEIKECADSGITPYVPEPSPSTPNKKKFGVPAPGFYDDKFVYDKKRDSYTCPAGNEMRFWSKGGWSKSGKKMRLYRTTECDGCPFRARCTRNKVGRIIYRWVHEEVLDEMRARLRTEEGRAKVILRGRIVEHPFGTIKRTFNQGYLLMKGLRKARGEIGLTMLAYNIRRAVNVIGTKRLMVSVGAS